MGLRLDLQTELETTLGSGNVYFQPPPNIQMVYPCIVYRLANINSDHADNQPYLISDQYSVTVIDRNPDSDIPAKIAKMRSSSFAQRFTKDGLNHTIFNIYF